MTGGGSPSSTRLALSIPPPSGSDRDDLISPIVTRRTTGIGAELPVVQAPRSGECCPIAAIPRYRAVFNPTASSARQPGSGRGVAFRGQSTAQRAAVSFSQR